MISIVVPFFNEEQVIPHFFARITPILESLQRPYEIVCVNDGSRDATLAALIRYAQNQPNIVVIDLSRNFGKEAALTAGLDHAKGEAVIPIDCDLQDPPELIPRMVAMWTKGAEVVLARRIDRSSDSWLKRTSAALFYKFHNKMSSPPLPENVGDYRLMDRTVINAIRSLPESRRFMKGLFAWAGFHAEVIDYERTARTAGSSKFNGWKLWNFAIEGITSFSTAPLKAFLYIGILVAIPSLLYAIYIMVKTIIFGVQLPGYASILVSILFLGGVQLIGIGVLGEYVGRAYIEAKRRPIYVVRKIIHNQPQQNHEQH